MPMPAQLRDHPRLKGPPIVVEQLLQQGWHWPLRNDLESGSPGAAISSGNSASPDAFDRTSVGAGASLQFDNERVMHGSLCGTAITTGSSVTCFAGWNNFGVSTELFFRMGFRTLNPSFTPVRFLFAGAQVGKIFVVATGRLQIQDSSNSAIGAAIPSFVCDGAWHRFEIRFRPNSALIELRYFIGIDDITPTDIIIRDGTGITGAAVDEVQFGIPVATANIAMSFDDPRVDATWMGPAGVSPPYISIPTPGRRLRKGGNIVGPPILVQQERLFPSGGLIFYQGFSGSISPTGTPQLQTNKALSGAESPAGSLQNLVSKLLAGSETPSGNLIKTILKNFTGSISPTGTLTLNEIWARAFSGSISPTGNLKRQVNKPLGGSISPTGALTKLDLKNLAGSISATGSLIKLVLKTFTGSISPTGTLTNIKTFVRSFSGSVSPTGALQKQVNKALSGSESPTGALSRQTNKGVSGSISPTGSLIKSASKFFSGSVSPTGVVTRAFARLFSGSISFSGSVTRVANKFLVGTLTTVGDLATDVIKGLRPSGRSTVKRRGSTDARVEKTGSTDNKVELKGINDWEIQEPDPDSDLPGGLPFTLGPDG